jgi:hypothetical protein
MEVNMDKNIKKEVGLWIDHRRAIIVTIVNKVEVTQKIVSNMEKHVRFSSASRSKTSMDSPGSTAEDTRDRQFENHLSNYYDEVISVIHEADSIWIFGPGEAKGELKNRLQVHNLSERIVGVDAADKMTDQQIDAMVRDHFQQK